MRLNAPDLVGSSKDGNSWLFIAFMRMIKAENNNNLLSGFLDIGLPHIVNIHFGNWLESLKILDMMKVKIGNARQAFANAFIATGASCSIAQWSGSSLFAGYH
jgi:hypothetical protein